MPRRSSAAKRYAEAVAAIARQDGSWETWRRDLAAVDEAVQQDDLRMALENPRVSQEQKQQLLETAVGDRITPRTKHLLVVLGRRGRFGLVSDLRAWFDELADRALGVRRYEVTSALPLTAEQRASLAQRLGPGGQVVLTERVEPELLGGIVIRHEDIIRDYSVRARLESLRERLN